MTPPQRGRFYVEKFLGCLKHHVGVACIGCVYLSKAAGAFTFAVALLIAQALEPRFEDLYDPVAGSFSWGGFTYTDECVADETADILRSLGLDSLRDAVGRVDLLKVLDDLQIPKTERFDVATTVLKPIEWGPLGEFPFLSLIHI